MSLLDGQRVVMGGIVTAIRTVTTRNKETMAVATFEDLQGTLEVVVFPAHVRHQWRHVQ